MIYTIIFSLYEIKKIHIMVMYKLHMELIYKQMQIK